MKKLQKNFILSVLCIVALGASTVVNAGVMDTFNSKASTKVKSVVEKNKLQVVGYDYVLKAIKNGTRKKASAIVLDARPFKKYQIEHIPSSLALPDTKFNKMYGEVLGKVDKSKELIIYCGGFKCVKSPKVAVMLLKKGHTNVKIYAAGMPEWKSKNYVELDTKIAKALFEKKSALFIDARPYGKFAGSTIVGSLGVPDTKFDNYAKFMPHDKKAPIVTYCGGYACGKSHNVAKRLVDMGYTNVKVYAAGFPAWKKAKYPVTGGAKKATPSKKAEAVTQKGLIKAGSDTGTVDGKWFIKNYKSFPKSVTLVDVRDPEDYASGTLPGAINIFTEKMTPLAISQAIPQTGHVIFFCGTGTRAMEARGFLEEDLKYNELHRVWYLDANIECDKNNNCKLEANEPIGI